MAGTAHHPDMRAAACLVALLTIGVIAVLAPLAYADPPDPSWIDGLWDDDDYDGVVVVILGTSAIIDVSLIGCGPMWSAVASVQVSHVRLTQTLVDDTAKPRAPPPSLSS